MATQALPFPQAAVPVDRAVSAASRMFVSLEKTCARVSLSKMLIPSLRYFYMFGSLFGEQGRRRGF